MQLKLPILSATVLLCSLLLSSCASLDSTTAGSDSRYHASFTAASSTEEEEVPLEDAESSKAIAEEVDLLTKSGTWGEGESSVVSEVTPGPEVRTPRYDFPVEMNNQVRAYIRLFQGSQRRDFARKLARSGRYIPILEKEFAAHGLPTDLAWLSMVESGFNPLARSSAGAVGLWQFMGSTGRMYNLKNNSWVDDRRNIQKSTRAAANYLGDLYHDFGDWQLAVAAYNAGPGKIRSGLRKYGVNNFWALASKSHLKMETRRYVPKLIATIIVARNPERYGFARIKKEKPLTWETISVGPSMTLDAVALIAQCSQKTLRQLNPELRKRMTPPTVARYKVRIPKGKKRLASTNMKRLHSIATTAFKSHRIAAGESITDICSRYNINATTLLRVNHLNSERLTPGKKLRIPYSTVTWKLLPRGSSSAMLAFKDSLILHKVKSGDTIGALARRYRVPASLIVQWNGLKSANSIRKGQQLALFIDKAGRADLSGLKQTGSVTGGPVTIAAIKVRKYDIKPHKSSDTSVPFIAAAKKKIRRTGVVASHGNSTTGIASTEPPRWYHVRRGDSLWIICKKFNISMAELKRMNGLTSNRLKPGSRLQIRR